MKGEFIPLYYTQNPGSSAPTHFMVLYTWDELIMSISKVGYTYLRCIVAYRYVL